MLLKVVLYNLIYDRKIFLYNIFGLVIICTFFFSGFISIKIRENELIQTINFADNTILVKQGLSNNYFSNENIDELESLIGYDYFGRFTYLDIRSTKNGQSINVNAVDSKTFMIGLPSRNIRFESDIVEDVNFLYGEVWTQGTQDRVVIVDEYTAYSTYGKNDVIGETLTLFDNDFEIVGVVTDTSFRLQDYSRCMTLNPICDMQSYASNVYVPYHFRTFSAHDYYFNDIQYLLIKNDDNVDLKNQLIDVFKDEDNEISSYVIDEGEVIDRAFSYYSIFITFSLVLLGITLILAFLNLINTAIYTNRIRRKENGIYRVLGATKKQMTLISLYKGALIGFISGVIIVILSTIITVSTTILSDTSIKYLSITNLILYSGVLILGLSIITSSIFSFIDFAFRGKDIIEMRKVRGDVDA